MIPNGNLGRIMRTGEVQEEKVLKILRMRSENKKRNYLLQILLNAHREPHELAYQGRVRAVGHQRDSQHHYQRLRFANARLCMYD